MKNEAFKTYQFEAAWIHGQWLTPYFVTCDKNGQIIASSPKLPENTKVDRRFDGYLFPSFVNAHSHSFQYAMAGIAETLKPGSDDFWSWRESMYALAKQLSPESLGQIAFLLFQRLLKNGYTHVVEFMYIHKSPEGCWYNTKTEIGDQVIAAAMKAGINITLVPIYYNQAGFGKVISKSQSRFYIENTDQYRQLICDYQSLYQGDQSQVQIGSGVHSLRAANQSDLIDITGNLPNQDGPFHIHVAEQRKEVEECERFYGCRPIEWLLDHSPMDHRFNLVHATHFSKQESLHLIKRKAHVVLCPSTEGNLGDGFFPFEEFAPFNGRWTIGTDSHVGICPFEELRWLDYGCRLRKEKRQAWYSAEIEKNWNDRGSYLMSEAIQTGLRSAGFHHSGLKVGQYFNGIVIDKNYGTLPLSNIEDVPAKLCFATSRDAIIATISNGKPAFDQKADSHEHQDMEKEKIRIDLREQVKKISQSLH